MSLRAAINAFCRQCLYDPHQPGRWREQITACTSRGCPLYAVRPTSKGPELVTLEGSKGADLAADEDQAA